MRMQFFMPVAKLLEHQVSMLVGRAMDNRNRGSHALQ